MQPTVTTKRFARRAVRVIVPAALALVVAIFAGAAPAGAATTAASITPSRTTGAPTSTNGASSMHVAATDQVTTMSEMSVVLEIVSPPSVSNLYFWAMQVDFMDNGVRVGSAHLGLQWDPSRRGHTAVNFGGYSTGLKSVELSGTSFLPSSNGNVNTRDFGWKPGRRYQLRISPAGSGWWNGEVTDLSTGVTTLVRRLYAGGTALARPIVWSEVFAPCDAPSTAVRWSDLGPVALDVLVTYQQHADGGCTNTTIESWGHGIVQRTNAVRTIADNAIVRVRTVV